MIFTQIMQGLEDIEANGLTAEQAAKMGFLEWALSLDSDARAAARSALCEGSALKPESPAACAFVGFLRSVASTDPCRPVRRGGAAARRRMLH